VCGWGEKEGEADAEELELGFGVWGADDNKLNG